MALRRKNMRNKFLFGCLGVSMLAFASVAAAQFTGPKNGTDMTVTVEQAKSMNDEAYVTLTGNIVQKVGKEKYLFKDATGSVEVEIDDKDWKGVQVSPQDIVVIQGEVDKGWSSLEIEVDTITKVE